MRINVVINFYSQNLTLDVDFVPAIAGKYTGPWEDSWPDEAEELRIISVKQGDQDLSWLLETALLDELYGKASDACNEPVAIDFDDCREWA